MLASESSPSTIDERKDFFISYDERDRPWAEWIAFHLESQGYSLILPHQDFRPGMNKVFALDRAIKQAGRTILLLSPAYTTTMYTLPEWTVALQRNEERSEPALLPIRIQPCDLDGLLRSYEILDLVGLDMHAAYNKLFDVLSGTRPQPQKEPRFPGQAPPLFGHLPERYPLFLGREEILKELSQVLHQGHCVALAPSIVVDSTSSVGKTSIATEYVYQYQWEYDTLLWIAGNPTDSTQQVFQENMQHIIEQIEGQYPPDQELEDTLQTMRVWLDQHTNWLLVLDGVSNVSMIQDLLPAHREGHVLITSRERSFASLAHLIDVDDLPLQEKTLADKMQHLIKMALHSPTGEHFQLGLAKMTLGSASDNHIVMNHPSVAPYHAVMYFRDHTYELTDLQSTTGTFLNEQRLEPQKPYPIQTNDRIVLGEMRLAYGQDVTHLHFSPPAYQEETSLASPVTMPSPRHPFLLKENKHLRRAMAITPKSVPGSTVAQRTQHASSLKAAHYYKEAVQQHRISPDWRVFPGELLPPSHLSDGDLHLVRLTALITGGFLFGSLIALTLLLSLANDALLLILFVFALDTVMIAYFVLFMLAHVRKDPHLTLSSAQAQLILTPVGFIEYSDDKAIEYISFHHFVNMRLHYDENEKPWLELTSRDGNRRQWSQHAYFGQPENVINEIITFFSRSLRQHHAIQPGQRQHIRAATEHMKAR